MPDSDSPIFYPAAERPVRQDLNDRRFPPVPKREKGAYDVLREIKGEIKNVRATEEGGTSGNPYVDAVRTLMALAEGRIAHTGSEMCPGESNGYQSRDPACPACQALGRPNDRSLF